MRIRICFTVGFIVILGVVWLALSPDPNPQPVADSTSTVSEVIQNEPLHEVAAAGTEVKPTEPPEDSVTPAAMETSVRNPYAASLKVPGKSKRVWDVGFISAHQHAVAGDAIEFELTEGQRASGYVRITQHRDGVLWYLSGELESPERGEFFFLTPPEDGVAGKAVGIVQFHGKDIAYRIEPTGPGGEPELWERRLDEVMCLRSDFPRLAAAELEAQQLNAETAEIPPLRPDEYAGSIPSYNSNIVSLQSLPGARAVLLLDFFGGYTPTWGGVYYSRPNAANNHVIRDIWKRVAEDYAPFNINVTTDLKVYLDAQETSRQRVAFTDTPVTAAGVAYYGSWNWGGDTPCWSVYSSGKSAAEVASHEAGHTLLLSHQGQWNGTTITNEYYGGHGSGETGWAPIMGVGYYQPVAQWAKGEFIAANDQQDELAVVVGNNNNVAYRADDTGPTLAGSRYLEIHPDNSVFAEGLIERTGDIDAFQFTTTGGQVSLRARPVGDWSNLGMAVTLANSGNVVMYTNNPQNTLWAGITTTLPAGTYTFRVHGVGKNNPSNSGFSAYGSLGYYSIIGYVTGARQPTRLQVMERVPNGTVVGQVPANSSGNLSYTIASGNTGGVFAIDNNGTLTVANNAQLVYAQLATNSVFRVGYELFVNIQNLDSPELTEFNRRVVVEVLSTNGCYPVAFNGFNASIIVPYNATTTAPQATGFDIPNNWAFYQAGLALNPQIAGSGQGMQGFPVDRIIRSQVDGAVFQLGPYGGQNALMLGNGYPSSSTLTLATPQAFNKLAILASSANGGGLGTVVLNFNDGTKSPSYNLNAQDWYNTTTNVALQGFGRVRLGQATFSTENPGWSNPNLYQTTIDLASVGLNKVVNSITITAPATGGSRTTAILGVSGQAMPSSVAITKQPISTTNNVPASPVTFSVAAMGEPPLSFQWYRGAPGSGTPIAGATSTNLTLTAIQPSHAGDYFAVVTNSTSSATSAVATLTVHRAPQIVQQPTNTNLILHAGKSVSLSVSAIGALPLTYSWRTNGVPVPGGTAATLNLANLQPVHSGNYAVVVANAFGSVTSSVVSVTVLAPNYPYAQLVLANNPIGYWPLSELSGNVAYDRVGGRNGNYNNVQLGQPGHNLVDTHTSARFGLLASQNSYVGGIPIDFGSAANQSLTVECWVRGGVPNSDAGLITKGTGAGGEQFNLDCGGPGRAFRFFVRKDDGGVVGATGNIVPNNQWQHVVGVLNRSAGYVALYVNGVSNAAASNFPTENYRGLLRTTNAMSIGSRQGGTGAYNFQWNGFIQDVAVYNYALTPAQILAHYQAASNRAPVFVENPINRPAANAGQFYAAAINNTASDPNGDTVTYGKVSGPAWLTVSANGAIAGTPHQTNANANLFVVSARDAAGLSNVATLNIFVNAAPTFTIDPIILPEISPEQPLTGTLSEYIIDPNPGDTFSFTKVSGPDWVEVAADGALSGTPTLNDVGTNTVVVSVTDSANLAASATVLIPVLTPAEPDPIAVTLITQGEHLQLNWTGGVPPYQVEMRTNLTDDIWIPVGAPTTETSLLITPSNAATFYRVLGN